MRFKIIFSFFLSSLFLITDVSARWGTIADAPSAIEFFHRDIDVTKEGQTVETVEILVKVLNENGRNKEGIQILPYNETNQKLEILEAKTVFDLDDRQIQLLSEGQTFDRLGIKFQDVTKHMIEKQAILSENTAFDSISQFVVSYPNVKINSWIYLKTRTITSHSPLPRYFSTGLHYPGIWNKSRVTIRSELPFKILVHDVDKSLSIEESSDNQTQILKVTQKKPIIRFLIDEPASSIPDETKDTFVYVSTHSDFESLGNELAKQYNEILNQPLPPEFNFIVKAAQAEKTEVDIINTVTSHLIEKIRYVSDFRTIKGRFIPQSFKEIALRQTGDCKDFSSLTARILRMLGFKANVCLIYRGYSYLTPKLILPSLDLFNHAIVKAVSPSGKTYWIDPTNLVSMADYIFEDISDRGVLVLDEVSSYERTSPVNARKTEVIHEEIISFEKQKRIIQRQGTLTFDGQEAQQYIVFGLLSSKDTIEHTLLEVLSTNNDIKNYKFERDEIKSRTVKPVNINYTFEQNDDSPFSNEGPSFILSNSWAFLFLHTSLKQEGIHFLKYPRTFIQIRFLQNCEGKNLQALECQLKNPWFEASRTVKQENQRIRVTETVTFLRSFITPEEIRSAQFIEIKNDIQKYFGKPLIIFSNERTEQK